MKGSSKIASNMEKEWNILPMETHIKATMNWVSLQGMDNIIGCLVVFLKDFSSMD